MRFVATPNEMDFAIYVLERWDAGDLDSWAGMLWIDEVCSHLNEALLYVDEDLAFEADLDYEDLTTQVSVRAGVEQPPWGFAKQDDPLDPTELFEWWEFELEGYIDEDDYEYERAHDENREADPDDIRESLRVDLPSSRSCKPNLIPAGGFFVDGGWVVVWGDRLWRADGAELHEHAELSEATCQAYCQLGDVLVVRRSRYEFFVREPDGWSEVAPPVPIMLPDGVAIFGEQARTALPRCRPVSGVLGRPVIAEPSACGRYVRVVDRLGRGGVFDRDLEQVGVAGGPFSTRHAILGPGIDGRVADRDFWRALLPRLRAYREEHPTWSPPSAFARTPSGTFRHTDNGLTFYEDGRLLFVLDRLARCVSFSPSGHEVLVGYDDELIRIDVDTRRTLQRWSTPARFAWLRILLPPYQPDAYVEQIVSLWQILGVNERELGTPHQAIEGSSS